MKCPQCGTEFETLVEQCFTCGWEFGQSTQDFKPRTSKLAVSTLILGIVCLFTFYLPLLAVLIVGVLALRKIRKSRGRLTGERLAMAGILIPLLSLPIIPTIGYAIWSKDAGPVPNEFTEADFKQVRPENEVTYSILCQLNDKKDDPNGAPAIGLNKEDITQLEKLSDKLNNTDSPQMVFKIVNQNTDEIHHLWEESSKGRAVIENLGTYDEVADLSPIFTDLDSDIPYNRDMKILSEINSLHSLLLMEKGNDLQACQDLISFDAIIRKQSIYARSMILKLVCYAISRLDIKTANVMCNHPDISNEALHLLQAHFDGLNDQEMNLENSIIHEYLFFKNVMREMTSEIKNNRMNKSNSTFRYYDSICRNLILRDKGQAPLGYSPISVWPWEKPVFPKVLLDINQITDDWYDLYSLYNPIGRIQLMIFLPGIEKVFEIKETILIQDDLLQWVIAKRLGQEGSLKARGYSEEYTVDVERGLVFSVGPDGQAYTDDDIKLPIDPAVLGLK